MHRSSFAANRPERSRAARQNNRTRRPIQPEGLLRLARRLAAQGSPDGLCQELLSLAIALLDGTDGAVLRWNEARRRLVSVCRHRAEVGEPIVLRPGEGAAGEAVIRRVPIITRDAQSDDGGSARRHRPAGLLSVAAPLLHEGRLLGAVVVHTSASGTTFTPEHARILGLLADLTAATMIGVEQARLEGAQLTVRTLQHEVNNKLALTTGYTELLCKDPYLPLHLREAAALARSGAEAAANVVRRLEGATRLDEQSWGHTAPTTIDIECSDGPAIHGSRRARIGMQG